MRVTADVTRYATGDVRRTCVIPTDPTRTEPTKYSLVTFPSILTKVTRGAAAPIVTPSPLAHPDAMDGLTISLSDMPDIGGDGPPLCETALHCDSAIPADYLVQFTDPVVVDEWGDFVWPICTQCHGRGSRIKGDVEAWRIVQVLR